MLSITDEKWTALAETLQVERAALQAVAEVESGGSGFLDTRPPRPKVLFEGHYFHRLTGGRFDTSHPTLSFPTWTRRHYAKTGLGEWARLEQAIALDRAAALQSASWGAFQIMGANYAQASFADVEAFVAAQTASAESQLECFTRFIGRRWYLVPLREKDWALFAERYNGPAYAKNQYDIKLARAYAAWSAANSTPRARRRTKAAVRPRRARAIAQATAGAAHRPRRRAGSARLAVSAEDWPGASRRAGAVAGTPGCQSGPQQCLHRLRTGIGHRVPARPLRTSRRGDLRTHALRHGAAVRRVGGQ